MWWEAVRAGSLGLVALVPLWALFKFYLKWDRGLYCGGLAMVYGSALGWDSALTLLLALLLTLTLFFHTVYEESPFERHFGDAWRDDRRRVPRLVPFHTPGGKS